MAHLLALDQGTTSSRAIVFDESLTPIGVGQRDLTQHYPRPGWVEHDPAEIWSTQTGTSAEAIADAGIEASSIAAVGITNQRETTIIWDRSTGEPIHNAIVWQDRRTAPHCDRLRAGGLEPLFQERTGLLLDAYFSGTKIAWLLDKVPGARARAERGELCFGTVDSWLAWKLTAGARHITDHSNASRTLLMNLRTLAWDDELLGILNIPRAILPEIVPSASLYADATTGPLKGAPIGAIAGDQQAATFGQACFRPGQAKNTYGTGCFLLVNTGPEPRASTNRLISTFGYSHADTRTYCLEGSVFVAGAIIQWLRDGLGIIRRADEIEHLAASVPDTGGVALVPALTGLGAPHWDPGARGTITGITRGTTAAHIARAALEGIAQSAADLVQAMDADLAAPITELRVDGGAAANDLLMQLQADTIGRPVVRAAVAETTALGAAALAGLASGLYTSTDQIASIWNAGRTFEPAIDDAGRAEARDRWADAVGRALSRDRVARG
ncbi:MAG: glycerol kinase GlpK [Planctomycetota bacterium]